MRDRYILVLARNGRDATTYAKRNKLRISQYRAVSSAGSIRGIRVADVHELPDARTRPDYHAIRAELKHGRDIVYLAVEMPEAPPVDQGDGMGEQLDFLDEGTLAPIADRVIGLEVLEEMRQRDPILRRHKSVDPEVELVLVPPADSLDHVVAEEASAAEVVQAEPKLQRSRCTACGRLVTGPDDPKHDKDAHSKTKELFS